MTRKIVIVSAVLVILFCFSACGANDSASVANFSGEWTLESIEDNGNVTNMAEYKDVGLTGNLTLNEDLSMTFDLMGDVTGGTWKAKNSTEMSMTVEGSVSANGILVDGKLQIEEDKTMFVFSKKQLTQRERPDISDFV